MRAVFVGVSLRSLRSDPFHDRTQGPFCIGVTKSSRDVGRQRGVCGISVETQIKKTLRQTSGFYGARFERLCRSGGHAC